MLQRPQLYVERVDHGLGLACVAIGLQVDSRFRLLLARATLLTVRFLQGI